MLIDSHCHILPNLDDGPSHWNDSLRMAQIAVENGISTLIATPHQYADTCLLPTTEATCKAIRLMSQEFQRQLDKASIPLRILPGAELRMGEDLIKHVEADRLMTLADRGGYLLLELPHEIYIPIDRVVEQARQRGLRCILAHPERNMGILGRWPIIEQLMRMGVYLQVTGTSLEGTFGPEVQGFAEKMLQTGHVHLIATDAHGANGRRPMLGRAYARAADLLGESSARALCCENPHAILSGQPMKPVAGTTRRFRWFGRNKSVA